MIGDDEDGPAPSLLRRVGVPVLVIVLCALAVVLGLKLLRGVGPGVKPQLEQRITQVMLPPPPPPPPTPPPPPQKQVEEKPKEVTPSPKQAQLPKPAPMKAPAPPGNPLTAEAGNGPSAYGLGVGNGGGGDCIGNCGGGGGGDMDSYLASIWQSQIKAALARDPRLQRAKFKVLVDLAVDAQGHVTRATLGSYSGETGMDSEIANVLRALSPPQGLPSQMEAKVLKISITGHAR